MQSKKTLLVTGGTGSFGRTIINNLLLDQEYERIIVFSRDEKKQDDMRHAIQSDKLQFIIGDVRDPSSVCSALRSVDVVFHAAALKQVPASEFNPYETVKTNILGTQNVIEQSISQKIHKVVVLSTDKAVMPVNAMGISKAMAEKIALSPRHLSHDTVICCTRYGNVVASRGSVVPLFLKQILQNNEVTITDGDMTRFVMSLAESVSLVKYALSCGEDGDLFVKKAPAVDIMTLYSAISVILDRKPSVKIIGPRLGEKKHEVLVSEEEMSRTSDEGDYFRIASNPSTLNYSGYIGPTLRGDTCWNSYSSDTAKRLTLDETVDLLLNNAEVKSLLDNIRQ